MRLGLPILLLTTVTALAQPADKPFIYDAQPRLDLKSFEPPSPVTIAPAEETAPRPLPEASFQYDGRVCLKGFEPPQPVTIGPGASEMRGPAPQMRTDLGCGKPEAPKPPARGLG